MATTINRADIGANDDGTGTSGTVVNTAYVALAVYDKIDALIANAITFGSSVTASGLIDTGTTDASSSTTGSMKTAGGLGVAKKLYVGTDLNVAANVIVAGTTDASSSTTGSVTTAGGMGVAKKLFVGTLLDLSTATAGQVKFPATQNASADANTLDDYEEGTWTPVIGGGGGTAGQSYTTQVGRYVKIGRMVYASCYVVLSNKGTITGSAQIQGLPFAAEAVTDQYVPAVMGYWNALATAMVFLGGYVAQNTTAINLNGATAAAVSTAPLTTTDIGNTTAMMVSIVYSAAA